jgi:transcriptional regulator with GAF, ATPase, and Fis domain
VKITLDTFNLNAAERLLVETALARAGSIVEAAALLGTTRHAVKRRIIKHNIRWPRPYSSAVAPAVPERLPP